MDFLEGIGQRYLERKAYAAPQQLETLAKKQFKSATGAEKQAKQPSATLPSDSKKEDEIVYLRKQLAEAKAEKPFLAAKASPLPPPAVPTKSAKSPAIESRRSSTAETKPSGSTNPKSQERCHSTASSAAGADAQVAIPNSSPHRRTPVDAHSQRGNVTRIAKTPDQSAHRELQKTEHKHVKIARSIHRERQSDRSKPQVYAIYVEEEAPRRQRAPSKDVVEVSSGSGRTIYRVR